MFELVEKIGKYEIVKELGQGATSRVFLGHDPFANRDVAIKVLVADEPATGGGRQAKTMQQRGFLAEAALVGKLTHPHIVEIYDAGTENGLNYVVMEYVAGGTLEAHAEAHTLLPVGKVVEIIFKCVRALETAMREGIIHRDIKPGNILLTAGRDIKISDFGAAVHAKKASETTHREDASDGVIGSPAYMSPEQIKNETLTHQTDIYSLGVMMYRLLTGKLPYNASNAMSLAYAIINTDPPPPSSQRANLPAVLDDIVLIAMAKDRSHRYQNWMDFGRDLTAAFSQLRNDGENASDSEQFDALRALAFFDSFDDAELWEVIHISQWHEFKPGDIVIQEGGFGDGLYVMVDGDVDVSFRGQKVNTIKRGGCFGEMLYFAKAEGRRTTTIVATKPGKAIEIKCAALRAASDGVQAEFNKSSMQVLIDRLKHMNARMAVLRAGAAD